MIKQLCLALAFLCACSSAYSGSYTQTKYPIVLAHGMFGFDNIAFVDYWYGIPYLLRKDGAQVFNTQVSAINSSEERGEQLLEQVEEILAVTGAEKVNLIGHSHGGQSIRYVAAMIPDKIASVTTVGSPALGSPAVDVVLSVTGVPIIGQTIAPFAFKVVDGLGLLIGLAAGEALPQDVVDGFGSLSTEGAADFNTRFPSGMPATRCGEGAYQDKGIQYYSWSGTNSSITNYFDPFSYALALTKLAFGESNDGLVGRCSSHFGRVIRDDYAFDHFDEVNQILGFTKYFSTDPKSVHRQHANRLKNQGL